MPPKSTVRGKGRGQGRGESAEEEAARLLKEETERKKYKLIELVREYPVLYDTAHPDHLNRAITSVLWAEIGSKLEEEGK